MKKLVLAALALVWASGLFAAEDTEKLSRRYLRLKDSSDYYLGEGVATLKEFDGDGLKALEAARERARANLASAVRVRIISETHEQAKAGSEGNGESIESKSASLADVVLENVTVEDFVGVPEKGKVTALALLSKEDYRRQLAGKAVKVYHLESGLRLGGGLRQSLGLGKLTMGQTEAGDALAAGAIDFFWRNFYAGFQAGYLSVAGKNPSSFNGATQTAPIGNAVSYYGLRLGYDWAPWNLRVQPFVPVELGYGYWDMDPYFAQTLDAAGGLGLRYWANDTIAFQLQGLYHQNLAGGAITGRDGKALTLSPGGEAESLSASGVDFGAAIIWSGF